MSKGISVVTGGKGHVGFALVKELASREENIRLLLRSDSPVFDKIKCEKVMGDICDLEILEKAFEGAETVYHVAGVVDISGTKDKQLWAVNFEGTKNVVAACKKTGVKNLVYVSSVDAIRVDDSMDVITETNDFNPDLLEGTYAKTKAAATRYVLDSADESLKVCVVHPSACIGPYDNNRTSSMITAINLYSKGFFSLTFDFGGYNFVDVRDVAKGMVAAAEKGGNGECYLICGKAYTLNEFMCALADVCGRRHPRVVFKKKYIDTIIPAFEMITSAAKIPPVVNEYAIRKICENCNFSYAKAERELGYSPRPLEDSLRDTIKWLKKRDNDNDE